MDEREAYLKAGEITKGIKEQLPDKVIEGTSYLDLAKFVEGAIVEGGARPAFPVNISVNNVSAHDTPTIDDERRFSKGDYVKVDLGAHIDGYIADTAVTIHVGGGDDDLMRASKEALDAAIDTVRPGVRTNEVGKAIEDTIRGYGLNPIENLSGHGLEQYVCHSSPTLPNYDTGQGVELREGDVIAIEPFATDGIGKVVDDEEHLIFKYMGDRPVRLPLARKILTTVKRNYNTLPFAQRWLSEIYTKRKTEFALKYLVRSSSIYAFAILKEANNGNVTQFEHSMFVTSDGAEVFT
ncbi:MAG TPA: type II methionyl aminopeptidase [Candidatus Methanofastidiosa archaeon]|nr:type II methionyl aminopeptidase [Candidatus Methanofastidiosa archaeon]HPR42201.1 type II methionyl aminopeptidase [Candidatus Methanofastidiosa archaeon]